MLGEIFGRDFWMISRVSFYSVGDYQNNVQQISPVLNHLDLFLLLWCKETYFPKNH